MKSFTVREFKAFLAAVLKEVQAGHPIAITYGKKRQTLAVLIPYDQYVKTTQHQVRCSCKTKPVTIYTTTSKLPD